MTGTRAICAGFNTGAALTSGDGHEAGYSEREPSADPEQDRYLGGGDRTERPLVDGVGETPIPDVTGEDDPFLARGSGDR